MRIVLTTQKMFTGTPATPTTAIILTMPSRPTKTGRRAIVHGDESSVKKILF